MGNSKEVAVDRQGDGPVGKSFFSRRPWVFAIVLVLIGAVLCAGGAWLAIIGGSVYYLLAGLALIATGILVWRRRRAAVWLYVAILVSTIAWAVWESGLAPWSLMPRVLAPAVLGLWFAMPWVARRLGLSRAEQAAGPVLFLAAFALLFVAYQQTAFRPAPPFEIEGSGASDGLSGVDWPSFGGDGNSQRFVDIDQIDRSNVAGLEPAWTFEVNDTVLGEQIEGKSITFQVTPIKIGDYLYFCTPDNVVISLDADTGKEVWRNNPVVDLVAPPHLACRGLAYFRDDKAQPGDPCAERLLMGTVDNRLTAVDRITGKTCTAFGEQGFVDLGEGLGDFAPGMTYVTSPATMLGNVAVLGALNIDNQSTSQPPGVVRGFDARTGELLWAWDVLQPEAYGPLEEGETYPLNTPNVWSLGTADPELGLVYLPTGNTPPDFFGGSRSAEQDRYPSSIVALDAQTGSVRWSFQTVYHDVWDYDVGAQPVLVDLDRGGQPVKALIAATKRGEIFLLDRETGKPLSPIVEKPVPTTGPKGERLSPVQPYSTGFPSFEPADLKESSMWGATPLDQLWCRIRFRSSRYDGPFTPSTLQGSIVHPGSYGVIDWGSVSVDPKSRIMIVNTSGLPYYQRLIPRPDADAMGVRPYGEEPAPGEPAQLDYTVFAQAGTPYAIQASAFLSPLGFPCHEPPWGTLAAVDLEEGKVLWERPLGTTEDVAPLGIGLPMGVFNAGGSVTTSTGLVFIAATIDDYIRAFDIRTGEELWKGRLPAGGQANPISYRSGRTGKQYVVIASGGHAAMRTRKGKHIVAFALPDRE